MSLTSLFFCKKPQICPKRDTICDNGPCRIVLLPPPLPSHAAGVVSNECGFRTFAKALPTKLSLRNTRHTAHLICHKTYGICHEKHTNCHKSQKVGHETYQIGNKKNNIWHETYDSCHENYKTCDNKHETCHKNISFVTERMKFITKA